MAGSALNQAIYPSLDQFAVASLYFGDDAFMKRSSILISAIRLPSFSFSAVSNHIYSVLGL